LGPKGGVLLKRLAPSAGDKKQFRQKSVSPSDEKIRLVVGRYEWRLGRRITILRLSD
jgi:hypothetical protein